MPLASAGLPGSVVECSQCAGEPTVWLPLETFESEWLGVCTHAWVKLMDGGSSGSGTAGAAAIARVLPLPSSLRACEGGAVPLRVCHATSFALCGSATGAVGCAVSLRGLAPVAAAGGGAPVRARHVRLRALEPPHRWPAQQALLVSAYGRSLPAAVRTGAQGVAGMSCHDASPAGAPGVAPRARRRAARGMVQ
jgi:hypothetical protein